MKISLFLSIVVFGLFACSNFRSGNTSEVEDFDVFIKNFHSDSAFQMSRVQFPIQGAYTDYYSNRPWTSDNWELIKKSVYEADTTYYSIKDERKDEEVFQAIYCKGCGHYYELKFVLDDNQWFLTFRQENNF